MMAPGPDTGSCIVKIPFPVEIMQFRSPKVPAIGQIVREPYGFAPGMPEVGMSFVFQMERWSYIDWV